ncbi:unnamed protein product [Ixodes persulcatus]
MSPSLVLFNASFSVHVLCRIRVLSLCPPHSVVDVCSAREHLWSCHRRVGAITRADGTSLLSVLSPISRCLFHLRTTKCALVCCSVLESKIVYGNVKGVRVFLRFHSKTLSFFLASFYWLHRDPPSKCIQDEQGGSHHEFGDSEIRVICSIFRHFLP